MTVSVQQFLHLFNLLPEAEKQELAREILRRTINFDLPPLSNKELVSTTEELLLELDQREKDEQS